MSIEIAQSALHLLRCHPPMDRTRDRFIRLQTAHAMRHDRKIIRSVK